MGGKAAQTGVAMLPVGRGTSSRPGNSGLTSSLFVCNICGFGVPIPAGLGALGFSGELVLVRSEGQTGTPSPGCVPANKRNNYVARPGRGGSAVAGTRGTGRAKEARSVGIFRVR